MIYKIGYVDELYCNESDSMKKQNWLAENHIKTRLLIENETNRRILVIENIEDAMAFKLRWS